MTAQQIIDSTLPILAGLKISDTGVPSNNTTLLSFLNMAKNQIALDAQLWIDGMTIPMTTANEYTLSWIPVQIIDVYDDKLQVKVRGGAGDNGYFQTAPDKIFINRPEDGVNLYINAYKTPADYLVTDEVVIPHALISAMQYFIQHKAFDIYKSEKEIMSSKEYYTKYIGAMNQFLNKTDATSIETLVEVDMITMKGLV